MRGGPNTTTTQKTSILPAQSSEGNIHKADTTAHLTKVKRGNSPRGHDRKIRSKTIARTPINGFHATGLDLLTCFLAVGHGAMVNRNVWPHVANIPPDKCAVKLVAARRRKTILADELMEAMLDLVEWEYEQVRATGMFWEADVIIEKEQRTEQPRWYHTGSIELRWKWRQDGDENGTLNNSSSTNGVRDSYTSVINPDICDGKTRP